MTRFDKLIQSKKNSKASAPEPNINESEAEPTEETNIDTILAKLPIKQRGKSSDPNYVRATIYLKQKTHHELKQQAINCGCDISDLAEVAIASLLAEMRNQTST